MDKVDLKNEVNLKNKINKYIKKGKFDVKLDASEYTYNLLKHKYVNNKKLIGGAANKINLMPHNNSTYYVDLHGALLVKEYITIPDNLIVILPSCCGKSNYAKELDKFVDFIDIQKLVNEIDISKPIDINKKKHFIYIGGENICNMRFSLDFNMLSSGSIYNEENMMNYNKLNWNNELMKLSLIHI